MLNHKGPVLTNFSIDYCQSLLDINANVVIMIINIISKNNNDEVCDEC